MKRGIAIGAVLSCGLAFGASTAIAGTGEYVPTGTTNHSYSTTVGSFGGYGYTAKQVKAITGTAGYGHSSNVGGNYSISGRMDPGGSWTGYMIDDNQNYYLYNSVSAGAHVRAQFKNSLTTRVDVQVSGYWRSN